MARHREVNDRILTLLAMHPLPLSVIEIADRLGIDSWRVQRVMSILHVCGTVKRTRAPGRGKCWLWAHRDAKPVADDVLAMLPLFPLGTVVVTPSNREALIEGIDADGRATLVYLDGDPDGPPIKLGLLKAFQPGRARPMPARIAP